MNDIVEGQVITEASETALVKGSDATHQVPIFNPLDAEPISFKRQLESRSENYDVLAMHLRGILVPGKDFGQIHVKKDCKVYGCMDPNHLSDYGLWAPGADKVLGILGLSPAYPGEDDYIRAAVTGKVIQDVIMKCYILGIGDRRIVEGMGACSREDEKGDLNRTIKKACKRARLDAVLRLPAISALFEDDFLRQVARDASNQNFTTARQQQVNPKHDTGANLQVFPLKGKLAGYRFDEMDDGALDWCLRTFETSKPDIHRAALKVRTARDNPDEPQEPARDQTPRPPKQDEGSTRDYLAEYDREQAFENAAEKGQDHG